MKRAIAAILCGGVATFAGATALDDNTTRNDDDVIVESGGLGVFAIRVGDCIQLPDGEATEVMSVEGVPCEEPHDAQMYAAFDLEDDRYPQSGALDEMAFEGCEARWVDAIGTDFMADRVHDLMWFAPTAEGWRLAGDREVLCMVIRIDGRRIVGDLL